MLLGVACVGILGPPLWIYSTVRPGQGWFKRHHLNILYFLDICSSFAQYTDSATVDRQPTRNPSQKQVAFSAKANSHSFTLNSTSSFFFPRLVHLPILETHISRSFLSFLFGVFVFSSQSSAILLKIRSLKRIFLALSCSHLSSFPFSPLQLLALVLSTFSHCEFWSSHVPFDAVTDTSLMNSVREKEHH